MVAPDPHTSPTILETEFAQSRLSRKLRSLASFAIGGAFMAFGALIALMIPFGLIVLVVAGVRELFFEKQLVAPNPDLQLAFRTGMQVFAAIWFGGFVALGVWLWRREQDRWRRIAEGEVETRTTATFQTHSFNTNEEKPEFVNPGCFGDDVVSFLLDQLKARGAEVSEPGAEDFGWSGSFQLRGGAPHFVIVGYQAEDPSGSDRWMVTLERQRSPIGSLARSLGGTIDREAATTVHEILKGAPEVENLKWHVAEMLDGIEA